MLEVSLEFRPMRLCRHEGKPGNTLLHLERLRTRDYEGHTNYFKRGYLHKTIRHERGASFCGLVLGTQSRMLFELTQISSTVTVEAKSNISAKGVSCRKTIG